MLTVIYVIAMLAVFAMGFTLARSFEPDDVIEVYNGVEWHDASEPPTKYNRMFGTQFLTEHDNGDYYSVLRYCDGWNCSRLTKEYEITNVTAWAVIPKR